MGWTAHARAGRARPDTEHVRTELDDALDLARAGDEAGFTRPYRALQPRVVRYAATLVGGEAEDVAAEVWFQVPAVTTPPATRSTASAPPARWRSSRRCHGTRPRP